jgi:hypothetical protein
MVESVKTSPDPLDRLVAGIHRQLAARALTPPAPQRCDAPAGIAVRVREENGVDVVDLSRLVGEVARDVDEYPGAEIEQKRALPSVRPTAAGRAAAGAGPEEAKSQPAPDIP